MGSRLYFSGFGQYGKDGFAGSVGCLVWKWMAPPLTWSFTALDTSPRENGVRMTQNGLFPNSNLVGSFPERGLLDSRLRGNDAVGFSSYGKGGFVQWQVSPVVPSLLFCLVPLVWWRF